MSRPKHHARAIPLIVAFVLAFALFRPATTSAAPSAAAAFFTQAINLSPRGEFSLSTDASAAPAAFGSFARFGLIESPHYAFAPFTRLHVGYTASVGADSAVLFDVRASADGTTWTQWQVDIPDDTTVTFDAPMRFAQYRATLLANGTSPRLAAVQLRPAGGAAGFQTLSDQRPVAPTYKVHGTRMGMVGGRTANGHIIKKNDIYVSLPSRKSLSSKGGSEYMVRVSYNGKSVVAPVYDIGPWNINDNYWDAERVKYKDLPRGYPQDHAAYFDGYNKGRAEKGRVSFPTAIDVGDGVWYALGIKGDRGVVDVTFLWLGEDPLAAGATPAPPAPTAAPTEVPPAPTAAPTEVPPAPTAAPTEVPPAPTAAPTEVPPAPTAAPTEVPPAPTAAPTEVPPAPTAAPTEVPPAPTAAPPVSVVIDTDSAGFSQQAKVTWYDSKGGCGNNGHALWTYSTNDPKLGENSARWQPSLASGSYEVFVYIPDCATKKAYTASARYIVSHAGGQQQVTISQQASKGGWVSLGRYAFGEGSAVALTDVTGDAMQTVMFDAVKFVQTP